MNRALAAGAAGMADQQAVLDAIGANLANVDTPGFRASRPQFESLIAPDGSRAGASVVSAQTLFTQGRLEETDNAFDFAIAGGGLFAVTSADGRTAYTRAGNFSADAHGRLVLPNGAALQGVRLPMGTTSIELSSDGSVRALVAGRKEPSAAGRVRLASFLNPSGLRLCDDGLFVATAAAGPPSIGSPGAGGLGSVKQRSLERSNVSVVDAMMAILGAQRAYEANAKTVQAADEMLRLANNLERG